MSEAILRIPTPESCHTCNRFFYQSLDSAKEQIWSCWLIKKPVMIDSNNPANNISYVNCRHPDCPLEIVEDKVNVVVSY